MKSIESSKAPAAIGAFPEGGVKEQTRQSLLNASAILDEAGLSLSNVVKTLPKGALVEVECIAAR